MASLRQASGSCGRGGDAGNEAEQLRLKAEVRLKAGSAALSFVARLCAGGRLLSGEGAQPRTSPRFSLGASYERCAHLPQLPTPRLSALTPIALLEPRALKVQEKNHIHGGGTAESSAQAPHALAPPYSR